MAENNIFEKKEEHLKKEIEKDVKEAEKLEKEIEKNNEKEKEIEEEIKKDITELKKIEHEENKKVFLIIVNTREKEWMKNEICFNEVVILAFGEYKDNVNIVYTVKFTNGPHPNEKGSLTKGKCTKVKKGMVFSVTETDKS